MTTLMQPSVFSWNVLYISGASPIGTVCVTRSRTPSGSAASSTRGRSTSVQRRTLPWPIPSWICLSNIANLGNGATAPAVDTGDRHGAAPPDGVDRGMQDGQPVHPDRLEHL